MLEIRFKVAVLTPLWINGSSDLEVSGARLVRADPPQPVLAISIMASGKEQCTLFRSKMRSICAKGAERAEQMALNPDAEQPVKTRKPSASGFRMAQNLPLRTEY
ncbi:MAG: hypothetical protein WBE76_09105 [Terracidiphilus sp.]